MHADYSTITETPGDEITREAASMLVTRYAHAARYCAAKDVVELACGSGQGLGYLGRHARRVVGGDCTERLLRVASQHYGARFPLIRLDAERLPFASSAFDVVILHEAIYYLRSAVRFFDETRRVLRPGGMLIMSTVNREWRDFNPSPFSHWYPTAAELKALLETRFARVEVYGGFPAWSESRLDASVFFIKRLAVQLRLMPKTMRSKRFLKRVFFGRLVRVPREITAELAPYCAPVLLPANGAHPEFKVLFAVAMVGG